MFPFLSAVNVPDLLTVVTNVFLFDADGFLPPPFTHSYVTAAVAEQVTVSTEPDASPASLNLQARLLPLSEMDVAFLMKCGLPDAADAPVAVRAAAAISAATSMRIFLICEPPPWAASDPPVGRSPARLIPLPRGLHQ